MSAGTVALQSPARFLHQCSSRLHFIPFLPGFQLLIDGPQSCPSQHLLSSCLHFIDSIRLSSFSAVNASLREALVIMLAFYAQRYSATNILIPVFLSSSHHPYYPASSPIYEFCLCTFASDLSSLTPPSTSLVLIRPKHCRHAPMQGRQPDLQFISILSANGCIVHLVLRVKPHRPFGCRYVMKILILVCPEWLRG